MTDDEILERARQIKFDRAKALRRTSFHGAKDLKLQWTMWQGGVGLPVFIQVDPADLREFLETIEDSQILEPPRYPNPRAATMPACLSE